MKEKILALLKTKFVGVQDAPLNRIAEKLAKTATTDELATTAVEGVTIQQVIESYADSRATEASLTASQNALKKFREDHGLDENGKPIKSEPAPIPGDSKDIPAWAQSVITELRGLKEENENIRKAKTQEVLMGKLVSKLKDKGVDEDMIPLLTRGVILDSEDKIDAFVTETETTYKDLIQKKADKGVVFNPPANSSGAVIDNEVGKKIAEKRNANASEGVAGKKL